MEIEPSVTWPTKKKRWRQGEKGKGLERKKESEGRAERRMSTITFTVIFNATLWSLGRESKWAHVALASVLVLSVEYGVGILL